MVRIKFGNNGKPLGQDGVETENVLKRARPSDLNESSVAKKQKTESNNAEPELFSDLDMPKELLDAVLAEFKFEKLTEIQVKHNSKLWHKFRKKPFHQHLPMPKQMWLRKPKRVVAKPLPF